MLSERLLRDHPQRVRDGLVRRHAGDAALSALADWLALDTERRLLVRNYEARVTAEQWASLAGATDAVAAPLDALRTLHARLEEIADQQRTLLARIPNLPADSVPDGRDETRNTVIRTIGEIPRCAFSPRRHDTLARELGLLGAGWAATIAGPRFPLLIGEGARLARLLAQLMLDHHTAHGYIEVAPPHLVRDSILAGTGHLPRYADDLYRIERDELSLSPTAEVQLVALHAGQTLPEGLLPLAYTAHTPAFRREAGSSAFGRGLIRQHQFDKVELVRICTPEQAPDALMTIVRDASAILELLELPYRVVHLCAGELPFTAQETYDLEVWMPGEGRYVEIASISDCGTYQARGLEMRYKPHSGGRSRYPHTLNGSALAIGRTLAAVLENGQAAGGRIRLPAALARLTGYAELPVQR